MGRREQPVGGGVEIGDGLSQPRHVSGIELAFFGKPVVELSWPKRRKRSAHSTASPAPPSLNAPPFPAVIGTTSR